MVYPGTDGPSSAPQPRVPPVAATSAHPPERPPLSELHQAREISLSRSHTPRCGEQPRGSWRRHCPSSYSYIQFGLPPASTPIGCRAPPSRQHQATPSSPQPRPQHTGRPHGSRPRRRPPALLPELTLPSFPPVPQPWPGDPASVRPGQFWRLSRGSGDRAWGRMYQLLALLPERGKLTLQRGPLFPWGPATPYPCSG